VSIAGIDPANDLTHRLQIIRSTRLISILTLLSRIFGYTRDLVVALLLGTSFAADAFVLATRIHNLLRRMTGEGAMTGAFVPVFTSWRVEKGEEESWDFARRMFWTMAVLMAGVLVIGLLITPWLVRLFTAMSPEPGQWTLAVTMTRITFPYILLITLAALASASLNSVRVFGLPAATSIFLNMAIIGAGFIAWWSGSTEPAIVLAVGYVIGGALQFLIQVPSLIKKGMPFGIRFGFDHPAVRRVGVLMLPAFAGLGIHQINVLISTIFASKGAGWMSALYYADRVMELVLGAYAVSVATVILPVMSQQAAEKKLDGMKETLGFSLRNVAFLVIPAMAGLLLLREPIIRLLFERKAFDASSTELTTFALLFYAIGLPAFAAVHILVRGFYALQDMKTPVRAAGVALVVNVLFCALLINPLRQGGLALAASLAGYANLFVLYMVFRRRWGAIDERRMAFSLFRIGLATALMGAACWWVVARTALLQTGHLAFLLGGLSVTIAGAVVLYAGLAWTLGANELNEFLVLVTGRQLPGKLASLQAVLPTTLGQK
jgi:putative peptidoglycan lipid II flippase